MVASITWQIARASGIVSWGLVTAAVIWGLLLSTRLLRNGPGPRWLTDLHRFLGGLSVTFVGVHLAGLAFDSYVHFGLRELFVPFASSWKPTEVALGVTAFYVLVAVELTSLAKRRLPRRAWRYVHLTSYGVFVLATVHGLTAGTDARNPILLSAYIAGAAAVLFLTLIRILSGRSSRAAAARARSAQSPAQAPTPSALVAAPQ